MNTYSRPLPRRTPNTSAVIKPVLPRRAETQTAISNWEKWRMPPLLKDTGAAQQIQAIEDDTPAVPSEQDIERERHEALLLEIEQIKQQAYEQAYADGLEAGQSAGLKQGYRDGYENGLARAQETANALTAERLALLENMATAAKDEYQALENELAQSVLALAIRVAQQVLGHELRAPTDTTLQTIRLVLSRHDNEAELLTFWLHPDDLSALQQNVAALPTLGRIRLLSDISLTRGGVRVQTPHGDIDATLETRWRLAIGALGHQE